MKKKNNYFLKYTFLAISLVFIGFQGFAEENIGLQKTGKPTLLKKGAGCAQATQQKDLDLNNVRTTILNGGDMWWNLQNARYEIPKVETGQTKKHSLFSGALWIGGITQGNLKIAAQTYRQSGSDYYPGALQIANASVSADRCKYYDKIWKVTLAEIEEFQSNDDKKNPIEVIKTWPGNGNEAIGEAKFLAPFFDNGIIDGIYNPEDGDFPSFDQNDVTNIPDMMLFTVYNDKGNIHSETEGLPIGLELHTQSFAYATNDEINNMTFYRTTIFNRSSETIDSCVFGQWVDADLGNYSDDYVECDVKRNLGICYNGDDNDEGILGYGLNPPSVGVNFFEGPQRIVGNDTSEIGLTKFVYYNNDFSVTGNPSRPEHYWNYLNGRWKDGLNISYGGNGRGGSDTASFMFPGKTDPSGRADWTERIAGNNPGDRRFLQTAGSFSLLPGSKNQVTVAVVWARGTTGGATGSFNLLKEASDKAFVLYKNNFKIVDGPRVPRLEIVELDQEIILNIVNYNVTENYSDSSAGLCSSKTNYKFQGYQIFQLKKNSAPSDLYNLDEAVEIAQCDVQDGNSKIVNIVNDADLGSVKKIMVNGSDKGIVHSFKISKDVFSKLSDQSLVNFQSYYFYLVAYASATNCVDEATQYLAGRKMIDGTQIAVWTGIPHKATPHQQGTVLNAAWGDGPEITKLEGIGNGGNAISLSQATIEKALIAPYFVPTPTYEKAKGPIMIKVIDPFKVPKADFELKLIDNSKSTVKRDSLTKDSTIWILENIKPITLADFKNNSSYRLLDGNVRINIKDTTGEKPYDTLYANEFVTVNTSKFSYYGTANCVQVAFSDKTIGTPNEQIFEEMGLSINIKQPIAPGDPTNETDDANGFISSSIEFSDPNNRWLVGIPDELGTQVPFNWIRAGNTGTPNFANSYEHDFADANKAPIDPRRQYNKVIDGTWAPYSLCARVTTPTPTYGPAWSTGTGGYSIDNPLTDLRSVSVFITSDKRYWSRCVVIEAGENAPLNIGGAIKMQRRKSPSVGKDGKPDGDGFGKGWFPGYAINKETGERLNIMFAEDSSLPLENGADMIWNPTSTLLTGTLGGLNYIFGGKHHIYVMGSKDFRTSPTGPIQYAGPRYDEGVSYDDLLTKIEAGQSVTLNMRKLYSQAMWVSMTLVSPKTFLGNHTTNGGIPCDVRININVKRPYASLNLSATDTLLNRGLPLYSFSTTGISPTIGEKQAGKTALDMVAVSPNPYYAYAGYEDPGNQLDQRVKIINLPKKCVVSIYTQSGFLVRRIRKDDDVNTYLDWDLKNDAKVPIASGVYLVHIYADGIGERVVKWFGIMRPADFDTF